jgi:hypothetical protein
MGRTGRRLPEAQAEVAKWLKKHGLKETEASNTNKLARRTFLRHSSWLVLRRWNLKG